MKRLFAGIAAWFRRNFLPAQADKTRIPDRLTLDFSPETRDNLQKLMDQTEIRDRIELVIKSFACLYVLTKCQEEGVKIIIRRADGTEEEFDPLEIGDGN